MAKSLLALVLILSISQACFLCGSLSESQMGYKPFLKGIFDGFQINPSYPSPCIRKFSDVHQDWSNIILNLETIFKTGDISYYFDAVSDFSNWTDDLDDSISICELDIITEQLANLFSPTEASAIAVRISANSGNLIIYWQHFAENLRTDSYTSGLNLGKFFSVILDYHI